MLNNVCFRASWQKQVSRPKGLTAAEVRERPPTDLSLVCPIDNKLIRDAVKTPCCDKQYCEECIQTHLLERDFVCPNCGKKIGSLDKLVVDKPMRTKVNDYVDKAVEDSKKESDEAINLNTGIAPVTGDQVRSRVLLQQCKSIGFNFQSRLRPQRTPHLNKTWSFIPINSQVATWTCLK
jgi:hypothetical protein